MTAKQELVWSYYALYLNAVEAVALSRNLRGVAIWRRAIEDRRRRAADAAATGAPQ